MYMVLRQACHPSPMLSCIVMSPLTLRIKELRERRGWSQAELARRAGVAQPIVNRLERGKTRTPSLDNLEKLADALGVSPRALLKHQRR